MRTRGEDGPDPLDVALGLRVREVRNGCGLSQDELGREVGVSFQQMQKYEHGANRISFSRLVQISEALGMTALEMIAPLFATATRRKNGSVAVDEIADLFPLLKRQQSVELLRAFANIPNAQKRTVALNMIKAMVDD
jgi:transcriptional regulator with XRE-family HTH domain